MIFTTIWSGDWIWSMPYNYSFRAYLLEFTRMVHLSAARCLLIHRGYPKPVSEFQLISRMNVRPGAVQQMVAGLARPTGHWTSLEHTWGCLWTKLCCYGGSWQEPNQTIGYNCFLLNWGLSGLQPRRSYDEALT